MQIKCSTLRVYKTSGPPNHAAARCPESHLVRMAELEHFLEQNAVDAVCFVLLRVSASAFVEPGAISPFANSLSLANVAKECPRWFSILRKTIRYILNA